MTTFPSPPIIYPPFFMSGVRYSGRDARAGAGGSIVMEKDQGFANEVPMSESTFWQRKSATIPEPVSGPIERVIYEAGKPTLYAGHCCNCGRFSKTYKRAKEPALWSWAARHRCKSPLVSGDRDFKKPRDPGRLF